MKQFLFTFMFTFVVSLSYSFATNYYVAPYGKRLNKGTIDSPFKSLSDVVNLLQAGDTCFVREGQYREKIYLHNLIGTPEHPIVITNYKEEKAVMNGTKIMDLDWKYQGKGVYAASMEYDIWQLFADNEMQTVARWPNASMKDKYFWNRDYSYRMMDSNSVFGHAYDTKPIRRKDNLASDESSLGLSANLALNMNVQSLAETGVNMTGAIAILNIGSWMTWAQYISSHEAGKNDFTYSKDFSYQDPNPHWQKRIEKFPGNTDFWNKKNIKAQQGYYYIEGLQCLDAPGEWWYDKNNKMLYVIPEQDKDISKIQYQGKVQTYMVEFKNCSNLVWDGIDFWGATIYGRDCSETTLQNVNFHYPCFSERVLGKLGSIQHAQFINRDISQRNNNKFINCVFHSFDGGALEMVNANGGVLKNILVYDANYSAIGNDPIFELWKTENMLLERLTIYNSGTSSSIHVGDSTRVTMSRFYNVGDLQSDGAPVQVGYFYKGVEYDHIWSHDHLKLSLRFDDGGGAPKPPSLNGQIHHNVMWNCGQMQVKGDKHAVYNNTAYRTPGICMVVNKKMCGIHKQSYLTNNLSPNFLTLWWGKTMPPFPGYSEANVWKNPENLLRDPKNGDFRPKKDSWELIDKGVKNRKDLKENLTIGAYTHNCTEYWIPGYQYPSSSTPVPFNKSIKVKQDASLMWLKAYQSVESRLYLGTSKQSVIDATEKSIEYKGSFKSNMYNPYALKSGKTYFWRVDELTPQGLIKGEVWEFTIE